MTTPPPPDTIRVTLRVVQALEDLDIPYLIGGSLACAVHGLARATMDADLVADIRPEQVKPLARRTAQLLDVTSGRQAYMATAEDTLLAKLEWYRLGGEVSER
jgi:hypothetical protein